MHLNIIRQMKSVAISKWYTVTVCVDKPTLNYKGIIVIVINSISVHGKIE